MCNSTHKIIGCATLTDNSHYIPYGHPNHDRIYKIRPLITHLLARFKSSYTPSQNCSIDESIISFKGRLAFIQYMPLKPHKWGVKAWVLADSVSGYIWNWKLYTGKEESNGIPVTAKVVLELTKHFYFDNFYTSPYLCKKLFKLGSGSCGTVRTNRKGIPIDFKNKKLQKGEMTTYQDDEVTGIKWMDRRPVAMLSTIHDDSISEISRRSRSSVGVWKVLKSQL